MAPIIPSGNGNCKSAFASAARQQSFRLGRTLTLPNPRSRACGFLTCIKPLRSAARCVAKRLADRKAGVVAFSLEVDNEADFAGEPVILFRAGQIPGELEDA